MAITTTIRARIVPASMLMPNTRASIVKLSGSMRPKKRNPIGKPQKLIASPHLMAVLRRLDQHKDSDIPDRRKNVNTQSRS